MLLYKEYSDQQLIGLLRSGDELAFKELYNRYWDILLDTAYKRLSSIKDAEEIVQDIFTNLYIRRESLEIRSSFEGYLRNALKYKIFDVFRSQYTHNKHLEGIQVYINVPVETPEEALHLKELSERIDRVIRKMPEKCREVFVLSRIEELSNKSIAEKLSISVSTVEKHISKAKKILKLNFKTHRLEALILPACQLFNNLFF